MLDSGLSLPARRRRSITDARSRERHHVPPGSVILVSGELLHPEGGATRADGASGWPPRPAQTAWMSTRRPLLARGWPRDWRHQTLPTSQSARCGCRPASSSHLASRRLIESIADRQSNARLCVVATLPAGTTLHELTGHLALAAGTYQSLPIVLGLPSTALKGGRPHLVQLGGIRRFAEEWDLTVAVDLSGQFDPTWEAEAAVARLGERLGHTPDQCFGAVTGRSWARSGRLSCAARGDGPGSLSGGCGRAGENRSVSDHAASRFVRRRRAMDYIAERAALHARALREGISRYEGSPSSRGI